MRKIRGAIVLAILMGLNYTIAIVIQVPPAGWNADINVQNPVVEGDESTLFVVFQFINQYLRFFMGAIAMGVLIYGGFLLMTANGDSEKVSQANQIIIGAGIGIGIVLISYAAVRLIVNIL
jgi:hypothetical protein